VKVSDGPVALVPSGVVTVTLTDPAASAGEVAVIEVSEFSLNVAEVDPKSTAVAPVKPLPVIVTDVPPVYGPDPGLTDVTVGGVKVKVSAGPVALVPLGVVTVTSTGPTDSAGEVAVIEVSEFSMNNADVPPKSTAVAPVNPLPVIVTEVPPVAGPALGLTEVTVGGEAALAEPPTTVTAAETTVATRTIRRVAFVKVPRPIIVRPPSQLAPMDPNRCRERRRQGDRNYGERIPPLTPTAPVGRERPSAHRSGTDRGGGGGWGSRRHDDQPHVDRNLPTAEEQANYPRRTASGSPAPCPPST
jgi:hypothetical protein